MGKRQEKDSLEIFASAPIAKAVLINAVPAMLAMLMVLVYNLADTFFVGQTHNDLMVAAVSLAMPAFLIFMAFGNVFGMGGTSVISRALGEGRKEYAVKVCSFCMWSCVVLGTILSAVLLLNTDGVLRLIGASPDTWDYLKEYMTVVAYAGPSVMVSTCYSNVVRTEGKPGVAMAGQMAGNILNIILDPLLILYMDMGVAGAAWATTVSYTVSALFYVIYLVSGRSILSIHPKYFSWSGGIFKGVMAIGIPASLGNLLMSTSNILANSKIASYGDDMAVAGYGVAIKINMITGILCIGFAMGVQPLLGYCIGARNYERFGKALKLSEALALSISLATTALCFLFAKYLCGAFLTDAGALSYAVGFERVLLSTSWLFGIFYVSASTIQAMGEAGSALLVNLSRQGIIYIPALFVLNGMLGLKGLIWAQPVADVLSTALVAALLFINIKKLHRKGEE